MPGFFYTPALLPLYFAMTFDPSVIALIAALAAPVATYIIAARRFSGKIQTTEASDLWAESRDIRKWSRERIEQLERRVDHLEDENRKLRRRLNDEGGTVKS